MNNSLISVKGNKDGLQLLCSDIGSWQDIIAEIKTLLSGENRRFFRGASVLVDTGTRILDAEQVGMIWQVLRDGGLTVRCLKTGVQDELTIGLKSANGARERVAHTAQKAEQKIIEKDATVQELSETEYIIHKPVLVVRRNLRSGQKVAFDGNVIVYGDVNPGAEVIASGFIMVFGYLRGIAHAGSGGDERAWVMSYKLQPTQLRIANSITRPPDEEPQGPEIAKIQDGVIVCEGIDLKKYYNAIGGN
ncbi:MAG: septum site-determining protein MinC [Peptococcia bacterium]|jgi:septum site-determining protein MinC